MTLQDELDSLILQGWRDIKDCRAKKEETISILSLLINKSLDCYRDSYTHQTDEKIRNFIEEAAKNDLR